MNISMIKKKTSKNPESKWEQLQKLNANEIAVQVQYGYVTGKIKVLKRKAVIESKTVNIEFGESDIMIIDGPIVKLF